MADTTAADLIASTHPAAALLASIKPELASRVAVDENVQSAILPSAITRKYLGHTYTQFFYQRIREVRRRPGTGLTACLYITNTRARWL
jgi:hypothetical protein